MMPQESPSMARRMARKCLDPDPRIDEALEVPTGARQPSARGGSRAIPESGRPCPSDSSRLLVDREQQLDRYRLTEHAALELERRGLPRPVLAQVLEAPEQRVVVRPGRTILRSRVEFDPGRIYPVRIAVDFDRFPAEIVTVYRTSRIEKYWRVSP